jgi:hypothetical protein
MNAKIKSCFVIALLLSTFLASPGHAQFHATTLKNYCDVPTLRQTVVYVDDTVMIDGRTDWAVRLSTKLRGALLHGEMVSVVRLSPATGQSQEIWKGCWPGVTESERAALHKQATWLNGDPVDEIDEQTGFFARDFGQALSSIYVKAKQPANRAAIDPAKPPQREILRALASDGSRFGQSHVTIRALVYSNLAENSSLGSVFQPPAGATLDFGKRLQTSLRRGVFYLFGLGEGMPAASINDLVRSFWTNGLRSMDASVEAVGTDLNLPNVFPSRATMYSIEVNVNGQLLDGRLSLLADRDGTIVDSWISVQRLAEGTSSLSGTYVCRDDDSCRLDAIADNGLLTTVAGSETVSLSGTNKEGMTGQIAVKGTASFPLRVVGITP